jgi:hypothetical protein
MSRVGENKTGGRHQERESRKKELETVASIAK